MYEISLLLPFHSTNIHVHLNRLTCCVSFPNPIRYKMKWKREIFRYSCSVHKKKYEYYIYKNKIKSAIIPIWIYCLHTVWLSLHNHYPSFVCPRHCTRETDANFKTVIVTFSIIEQHCQDQQATIWFTQCFFLPCIFSHNNMLLKIVQSVKRTQ